MPLTDDTVTGEMFTPVVPRWDTPEPKPASPGIYETFQAAGRMENDIVAGVDLLTQPQQKVDPTFNLVEEAKKRNVEPGDFTDALNANHLDALIKKRDQEIKDNSTLDEAGWLGFAARMAAGLVSPTTLLPMIGPEAKGLQMMATVGLNAAAGAGLQEGVLYANQRTRTKTQAAYSIGSSFILGSVLGAISHTLSKSVVDKIAHDMDNNPNLFTISKPHPGVNDAGAADATHLNDAGQLKKGWGAQLLAPLSPITRGFEQWNAPAYIKEMGGSAQLRKMTAGFSQGGLALDKNREFLAASPGGSVEDLKRTYAAVSYNGSKILEDNYIQYILGTEAGGLFKKQRAYIQGATRPDGKLTYDEFKRQITLDIWSNFSREGVPDMVRKAAKEIDEHVYKKLYDEGVEVGIFTGKEKTVGDENYANRVYNNEVIMRRHNEFVKILADHYRDSLNKDFNEKLLKLNEAMQKDKQLFEDANLPFDKARQLREDLLNEQLDVEDATNPAVLKGSDQLRENNKIIRELTTELENLKKVKLEGSDLEGFKARQDRMGEIEAALKSKALENEGTRKALGTELEKYQLAAKEIRRRLNNLNQNVHVQDAKMKKKLDKISVNEDAQVTTILRAQKQLQKFVKMLESVSDDKLDAELKKLKDLFHKNAEAYDKLDERLRKYMSEGPDVPGGEPPPKSSPPDETPPTDKPPVDEPPPQEPPPELPPKEIKFGPFGLDTRIEKDLESYAKYYARLAYDNHKDFMSVQNSITFNRNDMIDEIKNVYGDQWTKYKPVVELMYNDEIAKGRAAFEEKLAQEKLIAEWKKPDPALLNMSMRDLEAAGLTKEEIAKIAAKPYEYGDVLAKLEKGYRYNPDGTFSQITLEEVDQAQREYLDAQNLETAQMRKVNQAFKDAGVSSDTALPNLIPNHPEPLTMQQAADKLSEIFRPYREKYEQAVNVWKRARDKREPQGVYPNLEPGTIESLGRQGGGAEIEKDPKKYRLNPDLNAAAAYFRTTRDAVAWIEMHGTKEQKVIVNRIKDYMHDAAFFLVDTNSKDPRFLRHRQLIMDPKTARPFRGVYTRERHNFTKDSSTVKPNRAALLLNSANGGINSRTLTHELLHAALTTRIAYGEFRPHTRLGRLVKELEDLRAAVKDYINKHGTSEHYVNYAVSNNQEMAANALTDPVVWKYFRKIPYKGKTLYTHFVDLFRRILGIPKGEESAFTSLLDITDRMLKEHDPGKVFVRPETARVTDSPFRPITLRGAPTAEEKALADLRSQTPSDGQPFAREASPGDPPEMKMSDRMDQLAKKMDDFAGKIEHLGKFDRQAFRAEVNDMMRELADTHAKINAKRTIRNEKLWKQVEHLGPEMRAKRMAALELKMKDRPSKFIARWNTKNKGDLKFNDKGLLEGNGDFQAHAEEMARETVGKILGVNRRLAYSDIIKEKRGPELARLLNIPSEKIKDFLETDIEKQLAIYTRTVGSDISVARVFGSPDAAEDFAKLDDERQNMLAKIESMTDKEGKPLDQKAKEELQYKTNKFYDEANKDLHVLLERAKGIRGIPKDAASWSARGAKMAMDLNFMRLMGNVVVSSVADPARIVMKYGLTRTFRDAFLPMITNWKTIRMSQQEAKLAGSGLDPVLHSRANSLFDIFDDAHRGTPIEKATHWASTKMGLIAAFDHWTSAIKQITAGAANAKLLDSVATVMEGKVKGKELTKAQEFLAKNNIDGDLAERIWKEVTNGKGGGKVNGIWLPNTDEWTDAGARRAYRAALGAEIDNTIITPGFERPNWVDSSIPARMIAQFKSFGFTSTQKTLMAGLQEHDLAFFNGVMSSLALGALSYYLYGIAAGGKTETEMRNAGMDKWADEAISRSGVTAIFDEAQRIATRVPLLQKYASFSGRQTTRRGGGDLVSETLGPSFDLLERVFKLGTEIDSPTKSTLHTARTILPLQNVFYLRRLLDKIEEAAGSKLPKRRAS